MMGLYWCLNKIDVYFLIAAIIRAKARGEIFCIPRLESRGKSENQDKSESEVMF